MYQILLFLLPLITAPYVARVLGVDGTGIYSYTHAYVMYFMLFGALGTVTYGTREIARHRDSKDERSQIFWEISILSFITTTVALLAWGIWILFNAEYRIYYIILTFFLLGTMFDISWFYAGMEEFRYTVTQNSIFKILGAVSIFIFVRKADDLWIYILILSLTTFLANVSMWVYLPRFIRRVPIRSIRLKRHFRETLVYFIPTIATSVYTILDKTLIGLITKTPSENGNYEQATKIINIAKSVCFAGVNFVFQSRISYLFAQGKYEEIRRRISASMDYILFMGIALCFGLIGTAERFIPFFLGPGYEKTIILLQFMSILIVIVGISNCLGSQYYNPAGLRAKSAKFIIAGSVINLILNILLIPILKSTGAVVSTIIAEGIITALYLHFCDRYYTLSQLAGQAYKKVAAGICMLVLIYPVGRIVSSSIIALSVQTVFGAAVYIGLLWLMKDDFVLDLLIPQARKMIKGSRKA